VLPRAFVTICISPSWQGPLEKQGFSVLLRTRTKIHRGESLYGAVIHLAQVRQAQEAERWQEIGYELLMR
jgi:hypothetical protein